jgi:hypothetical protein
MAVTAILRTALPKDVSVTSPMPALPASAHSGLRNTAPANRHGPRKRAGFAGEVEAAGIEPAQRSYRNLGRPKGNGF